jgi:hypothetical protein
MEAAIAFPSALPTNPILRLPSVSIRPGATALTRIFRGPNSFESATVSVSMAPLVAAYSEELGTGFSLAIELRIMIHPPVLEKYFSAS